MIEIAVVRHGETQWNLEERMQGHHDIALNGTGLHQAASIAGRLSEERWDAVISSDLRRAAVTGEMIAAAGGVSGIKLDKRLRERHFGRLEGTTPAERIKEWGEDWASLDHGVESDNELFGRAINFLDEAKQAYPDGKIIIVTHGGWIRLVFGRLFPETASGRPGNTSLSRIRKTDHGWQCLLYNSTSHLQNR